MQRLGSRIVRGTTDRDDGRECGRVTECDEPFDARPLARCRRDLSRDASRERRECVRRCCMTFERVGESIGVVAEHRDACEPPDELGRQLAVAQHRDRGADLPPATTASDEPRSCPPLAHRARDRFAHVIGHCGLERRRIDWLANHHAQSVTTEDLGLRLFHLRYRDFARVTGIRSAARATAFRERVFACTLPLVLDVRAADDLEHHATVLRAPLLRAVVGDRFLLAKAGRRQPLPATPFLTRYARTASARRCDSFLL